MGERKIANDKIKIIIYTFLGKREKETEREEEKEV